MKYYTLLYPKLYSGFKPILSLDVGAWIIVPRYLTPGWSRGWLYQGHSAYILVDIPAHSVVDTVMSGYTEHMSGLERGDIIPLGGSMIVSRPNGVLMSLKMS